MDLLDNALCEPILIDIEGSAAHHLECLGKRVRSEELVVCSGRVPPVLCHGGLYASV